MGDLIDPSFSGRTLGQASSLAVGASIAILCPVTQRPSNGPSSIPRTRVETGFSIHNTFFYELKHERSDVLVFGPKTPWKAAIWPVIIVLGFLLFEPLRQVVWRLITQGNFSFNAPLFFDRFLENVLTVGLVFGPIMYLIYCLVRKALPLTRFDLGNNLIHRPGVEFKMSPVRVSVKEVRMKVTEARGVQLCYGGFEKGDSESPAYDWWQLLLVGIGDPPLRAILVQSSNRAKMTKAGREIAKYLSVPWIDDGDFRDLEKDSEKILDAQCDSEGLFVDTDSSFKEGNYLNPVVVGTEEQDRFQVASLLRAQIRRLEKKKVGRILLVYLRKLLMFLDRFNAMKW